MPRKAKAKVEKTNWARFIRYFIVGAGLVLAGLFAAYLLAQPAEAKTDLNHGGEWTEWKDTTECKQLECGNPVGLKGQERQYVYEECSYSCPVIHWEYDFGRLHRSFDVEYEKSQDPTKCHRPDVKSLKDDYDMWTTEAVYFTRHWPEWKDAEVNECHDVVLETEARRTECRLEEVQACGTIRWCFPDEGEHDYYAEAIPNNEKPKSGFPWEEGMDKWCEFDEPDPEPQPEPKKEEKKNTFTEDKRCHDKTPPAITWINVEDGSANNEWLPRATWAAEGGDTIEVCFSETYGDPRWCFTMDNDGHETLGLIENTGILGMVQYYGNWRTVNGCKDGPWTEVDWFN